MIAQVAFTLVQCVGKILFGIRHVDQLAQTLQRKKIGISCELRRGKAAVNKRVNIERKILRPVIKVTEQRIIEITARKGKTVVSIFEKVNPFLQQPYELDEMNEIGGICVYKRIGYFFRSNGRKALIRIQECLAKSFKCRNGIGVSFAAGLIIAPVFFNGIHKIRVPVHQWKKSGRPQQITHIRRPYIAMIQHGDCLHKLSVERAGKQRSILGILIIDM